MASAATPATVASAFSYVKPFLVGIRGPGVGRAPTWREASATMMLAIRRYRYESRTQACRTSQLNLRGPSPCSAKRPPEIPLRGRCNPSEVVVAGSIPVSRCHPLLSHTL